MKTPALLLALFLTLLVSPVAHAQQQTARAAAGGYWNLETNLTTRDYTIVRFYNNQNQLVGEQRLDNLCLDLSAGTPLCRRTARLLNTALAQVLRQPESAGMMAALLEQNLSDNRRIQRTYAVR